MDRSPRRTVSLRRVVHWVTGRVRGRVAARALAGAIASALAVGTAWGCRLHTEGDAPAAAQALAPDFVLPSHAGGTVSLSSLLARGPAVLVFYRGHW